MTVSDGPEHIHKHADKNIRTQIGTQQVTELGANRVGAHC